MSTSSRTSTRSPSIADLPLSPQSSQNNQHTSRSTRSSNYNETITGSPTIQESKSNSTSIINEEKAPRIIPFPTRPPVERRKPITYIFPNIGPDSFSSHHPMIPKRYVPPWQLDMKNRYRIIENCQNVLPVKTCWGGHISYFWEGRERLNATSHGPYQCIIDGSKRKCFSLSSHLSRYNPSQMYYYNN